MLKHIAASAGAVAAFAMTVAPVGAWAPGDTEDPVAPAAAVAPATPATSAAPARPVVPVGPGQTEAGDGLRAEANTSFVVDPTARVIRASTEMTLTHEYDPDYYFFSYDVLVLSESVNHRAVRSDGATLGVDVEADENPEAGVSHAMVDLQPNLFAGDTITFRLDYDLPFQPPRATGWSRGNDAVVTFPAFTPGDPGLARLEVRLPTGYEVEMGGETLTETEAEGQIVLKAETIAEPSVFTSVIVATRDDKLISEEVEVAGLTLHLRAWPDDAAWIDYVGEQLGAQMPVLEELTGQSWPADRGELEVAESSVPGAHGYAGWFDHFENSITLGDAFDPATIAHELAHVWFNGTLFTDRWVNEGMADEYAESTLEQLGTPGFQPATMPPPDPAAPGAVALNDWTDTWSFDDVDHEREMYAYLASWHVMDQVADEIGVEGLRTAVTAAVDREMSYPADPEGEEITGLITWRVLLDLLENAGSTRADGLFVRYVANADQRAEMDARRVARTTYAAFAEKGGEWTPPFELRRALGTWEFEKVDGLIAEAEGVLAVRDEIEGVLAEAPGPAVELTGLEESYESARDLENVAEEAATSLDAAHAYRDAQEHHDEVAGGLIARVGLVGSGVDGKLDTARDDLAGGRSGGSLAASEDAEERLDAAVRNGLLRLGAGGLLVVLLVALGVWGPALRRRRRQKRDQEVARLEAMFNAPPAPSGLSGPLGPPLPPHPPTSLGPPAPSSPPVAPGPPAPPGVSAPPGPPSPAAAGDRDAEAPPSGPAPPT